MAAPALGQGQISNGFALHATFMTLSWVTFAGIGQLSARYLKNALSKNGVWFKLHMACLLMTTVCSIIGFFIMYADNAWLMPWQEWGSWENAGNSAPHAVFGLAALGLMMINMVMGFLRPGLDHQWRGVFNWCHFSFGTLARYFAYYCIYSAFYYVRNDLAQPFVVSFVLCQGLSYLYFEVYKRSLIQNGSAYEKFSTSSGIEAPSVALGKMQFGIYLLVNLSYTIAFIWFIWAVGDHDGYDGSN